MNRILAIASISLRTAFRSRIVICLLVALILVIIALPLTIKGDGTLPGYVQILLTYTLGVVVFVLSITTLWAGCASIAQEISERQIHLVLSKPVSRPEIWLGKWLSLLVLNAVMLAISAVTVYALLQWNTRDAVLEPEEKRQLEEEILIARKGLEPEMPDISRDVEAEVISFFETNEGQNGLPPRDAVAEAARVELLSRAFTADPGETLAWIVKVPGPLNSDDTILIRYKFALGTLGLEKMHGNWRVGHPKAGNIVEFSREDTANAFHTLKVPANTVGPDLTLRIELKNTHPSNVSMIFSPTDGMTALIPAGSFEANLLRAVSILFAHLALLAAIGVTSGSLLSLPVAALVSLYAIVLIKFIPYIEAMASQTNFLAEEQASPAAGLVNIFLLASFKTMQFLISPLETPNPLNSLGLGQLVSWADVGMALGIKMVLYGGVLCIAGGWLFNRREIGLPS